MAANDAPPLTPWLCDAVKAECQPNRSARKRGALVQALDVAKQPNRLSGGINCVLSDREHSVGAVLTPSAMVRWRQAMPTYEHAQLNCAILVLDSFDVAVNETTGQFTLRVHEFTWLAAAAETFGQPCCIMSDPTVHALFHRIAPACAPAPPPAPGPRGGGESYLLRLQRRSYPMARACFPVEARPPHAVLLEYAAIPRAEQSQLDLLVRASQPDCRAPAEEPSQGEELEIEAAEPCATATASSGAAPACVRELKESTSEAVACGFSWEPQLDVEEGIEPPGGTQILDQEKSHASTVAMPGGSQALVEPLGRTEILVEPPGGTQILVDPPGGTQILVEPPGGTQILVEPPGGTQILVEPPGSTQILVEPPGGTQILVEPTVESASLSDLLVSSSQAAPSPSAGTTIGSFPTQSSTSHPSPKRQREEQPQASTGAFSRAEEQSGSSPILGKTQSPSRAQATDFAHKASPPVGGVCPRCNGRCGDFHVERLRLQALLSGHVCCSRVADVLHLDQLDVLSTAQLFLHDSLKRRMSLR